MIEFSQNKIEASYFDSFKEKFEKRVMLAENLIDKQVEK